MLYSDKQLMSLWAKKEEIKGSFYWLPLMDHLADTMNVSKWLWNNWLSDSQRIFCINSISQSDDEVALNLAAFLGAIHDIGKATPVFQIQKGFTNSPDLDRQLLEKLESAGFFGISSLSLANPQKSHHTVAGEYLLKHEYKLKDDIGSIIGGHHGKPVDDFVTIDDQFAYPANYYQSEEEGSDVYKKWKQVQHAVFQWALEASGFENIEKLPEISQPAQVIYSGLLIMADWISSNNDFFPLIEIDEEHVIDSTARYEAGITLWAKNLPLQVYGFPSMSELFVHRFGFEPRDFQKQVYQTVSQIKKPGIVILEAPMGLGKTEAALAAAEIVASKTGNSGLFFGLPTQATSNGMFGRVNDWLRQVTAEYNVKQSLRLCHGKAALNEEMNALRNEASPRNINIDEENNGSIFVNEWFSGRKKSTLDDFVVGTVDGFLMTALKQKHLALKHLGFSKKIIIIDEVHAYDTYMQQYLEEAIRWMGAYGTPVILVSATLPQDKRKSLITAYLKGLGTKNRELVFPEAISGNYYPLICYSEGREVRVQTNFPPEEDKVVNVKKLNEEDLLEKTAELLENRGVIGIIVNTVRKAQKLGKECKTYFGESMVEILHSAFIATDRIKKESELLDMIGKGGKRPEKKIIIGTQVMEQSLDIDFDVLITDLCPVDLLLQRIGRLHRHDLKRPEKHNEPVVYVMGMSEKLDFEKGSAIVYGKYYLIRTQYYLPEKIKIPSDIPVLINKVYGDDNPKLERELESIYQESRNQKEVLNRSQADKARTYRLEAPRLNIWPDKYNLIAWLKNPNYSSSEELAVAQVRDIRETIEVIAVKKTGDGYGMFDQGDDISKRISEPQIAKELAKQTIRLPYYLINGKDISKIIDDLEEYNMKYLADWQLQPWLKGSLGIIFDENGYFEFEGVLLKYDHELGMREDKEYGKI